MITFHLIGITSGLLIEYWKLGKAFNVKVNWRRLLLGDARGDGAITWKLAESYTSNETQQHDQTATSHLLYVLMPLVVGYSSYSLIYNTVSVTTLR